MTIRLADNARPPLLDLALPERVRALVEARARTLAVLAGRRSLSRETCNSTIVETAHTLIAYVCFRGSVTGIEDRLLPFVYTGLLTDVDPEDVPTDSRPEVRALHAIALAALARERLDAGRPVRSARLAALGQTSSSNIRHLLKTGALRAWRGPDVRADRHVYVRADDAIAWLKSRWRKGKRKDSDT